MSQSSTEMKTAIAVSFENLEPLLENYRRRNTLKRNNLPGSKGSNEDDQEIVDIFASMRGNKRRNYDQRRFKLMFLLTGGFFLAELVTALVTGSLAMMSDAMHMLSDFVALVVGYKSLQYAMKAHKPDMTYGYSRAEVIGALVNSSGLLAICFIILMESIGRMLSPEEMEITNVITLLWVAIVGLIINLLGMVIFGHGHSHGGDGDGHSHGTRKHGHGHKSNAPKGAGTSKAINKEKNLNVEGVWLHVMGDALGSVAVIISACVIEFTDWEYRYYADPVCSIVIACIITYSTFPLFRKTVKVLMHATPSKLNISDIKSDLSKVAGVLDVHDLHTWSLTPGTVIGTAHIIVGPNDSQSNILDRVKDIFHKRSIHSSVIQIEAATDDNWKDGQSPCYDIICDEELSGDVEYCCSSENERVIVV